MASSRLYEVFSYLLIAGVAIGTVVVVAVAAIIVGSDLRGSWGRWSRRSGAARKHRGDSASGRGS